MNGINVQINEKTRIIPQVNNPFHLPILIKTKAKVRVNGIIKIPLVDKIKPPAMP